MGMEVVLDGSARGTQGSLGSLVASARRGDREAFRALVEPQLRAAVGAATILTGSSADGADAVQDALLSAWQGLDSIREPDAFPAWFRRHVIRAASRTRRRRGHGRVVELDPFLANDGDDVDRIVAGRTLGRAFDQLDESDRVLLTLHSFWRLSIAETAKHLGIPAGTVKSRIHHAMDRLRAAFDAEERR
jgi:RNA polymerase sigma factor (sigma-70 family)